MRDTHLPYPGRVLEVGAYNVNGTPRTVFEAVAREYIGTDMQAGSGVDIALNNSELLPMFGAHSFDTIICCECLEHDVKFWDTVATMREMLLPGGHLIVTTPALSFPYHAYPRHYVNFARDAYEDWFFCGFDILDLRHLDNAAGKNLTLAGIARKPLVSRKARRLYSSQ